MIESITLDSSVGELSLPMRAVNAFEFAGIRTVRQLCAYSNVALMRLPNLGRVSIAQVEAELKWHGFTLRTHDQTRRLAWPMSPWFEFCL